MILNTLFFDYDLKKAVTLPRIHNQLKPNTTVAEDDFEKVGNSEQYCIVYCWIIKIGFNYGLESVCVCVFISVFMYVCVCVKECIRWPGKEEPCKNQAPVYEWFSGSGGGETGGVALCRVWPQERGLSSGLLSLTSPLPSQTWSVPPKRGRDRAKYLERHANNASSRLHSHSLSSAEIHFKTWKMTLLHINTSSLHTK